MRPPYLSPSGWSTWEQCRRQWAFRYVEGHSPPDGSVSTVTGLVVHTVLDLWESHAPSDQTEVLWETLMGWSMEAHSQDLVDAGADPVQVASWSASSLAAYREDPFKGGEVLHAELRHKLVVAGVPVFLIIDRVDRLADGTGMVIDYKTGAKAKVNEGYRRQMVLSALAAEDATGMGVTRAQLWFLRAGVVRAVPVDDKARAEVEVDLARTWRRITEACLEEDFPPAPSPLCAWCAFEHLCPEGGRVARSWRAKNPGRAPATKGSGLQDRPHV